MRSNYSSLTQHSAIERKSSEKRGRGSETQDANNDRSLIKTDEKQKREKATEAVRKRKRAKKKTEEHFEESHSL